MSVVYVVSEVSGGGFIRGCRVFTDESNAAKLVDTVDPRYGYYYNNVRRVTGDDALAYGKPEDK